MTDDILIARIHALTKPLDPEPTKSAPRLAPIHGIEAVLFDVYGTLIISASGDIGANGDASPAIRLDDLLTAVGINAPESANIDSADLLAAAIRSAQSRARAGGTDYPEVDILAVWREVLAEVGLELRPSELRQLALEHECRANAVWPMPGLAECLVTLHRRGIVLGIVSNAQFYTPLILEAFLGRPIERLGLEPCCSAWSYRLGIAKPSIGIYQAALDGLARKHRIRPEQVLYVGNDMRNDIWPASKLELHTALFAGDTRSLRLRSDDSDLVGVAPDRIITCLAQIPGLVARTPRH